MGTLLICQLILDNNETIVNFKFHRDDYQAYLTREDHANGEQFISRVIVNSSQSDVTEELLKESMVQTVLEPLLYYFKKYMLEDKFN